MNWSKHDSNTSTHNPTATKILDKHGVAGYGRWIILKEVIVQTMDWLDKPPCLELPANRWCDFLKCKNKVLNSFLQYLESISEIKLERTDNLIKITYPKLPELLSIQSESSEKRKANRMPRLEETKQDYIKPNGIKLEQTQEDGKESLGNPCLEGF